MRRALVIGFVLLAISAAVIFGAGAGGDDSGSYKVRGIFDNASFLIPGQDVKIAGAKVGVVEKLDVQNYQGRAHAAIVMRIDRDGFKDFRTDARCEIRLQSVIGEKLVECTPTQPGSNAPPLSKIPDGQPGAGQYLLAPDHTVTPVDADLINNIQRRPFRERFSILLNELGTGLAARAEDIQDLVREANPGLKEFDEFLHILALQNRLLKGLTKNADTVLTALARKRRNVANFFVQSRVAAQVTAENRRDFERNFQKFPPFLRQLRPFMERFGQLSAAMAPVVSDLRASASDVSRLMIALGPFSRSSTAALESLGDTADVGRSALVNAKPVAERLATFTSQARKVGRNLRLLLTSIQTHKGIERFMDLLYFVALSQNGFDQIGHYLRNNLIVTICSGYSITPTVGCSANFQGGSAASTSALASSSSSGSATARALIKQLGLQHRKPHRTERLSNRSTGSSSPVSDGNQSKPAAPSPSEPAPKRPPSIDQGAGGDPLLDYLLGGAQ